MGLIDSLKDKAKEILNDPETKVKIQKLADEKGISFEKAKETFLDKIKK